VPEERSDHALVMAHFALQLQAKMRLVTENMALRLGQQ
jgi:hypothetical protein